METQVQNTSNIPATGWQVADTQSERSVKQVEFNLSGYFDMSFFSVRQIMLGASLSTVDNMEPYHAKLLAKLGVYAMQLEGEEVKPLSLGRRQVQALRTWLEARMKHCEEERDNRVTLRDGAGVHVVGKVDLDNPNKPMEATSDLKFNPDTYIAMKFLLLDIREWLAGDIIE